MSILTNGFGIISFISVTPLIAIQALGIIYDIRVKRAEKEATEESFEDLTSFVLEMQDVKDIEVINESEDSANE